MLTGLAYPDEGDGNVCAGPPNVGKDDGRANDCPKIVVGCWYKVPPDWMRLQRLQEVHADKVPANDWLVDAPYNDSKSRIFCDRNAETTSIEASVGDSVHSVTVRKSWFEFTS